MPYVHLELRDANKYVPPNTRFIHTEVKGDRSMEWWLTVLSGRGQPVAIVAPYAIPAQKIHEYRQRLKYLCENPSLFPPGTIGDRRKSSFTRAAEEISYIVNGLAA